MAGLFIFVFVAALAAAFVAQRILPPRRRARIIFAAAAGPSSLLVGAALIAAPFVALHDGWVHAAFSLAFSFITFMFVGVVAAIIGSELASLSLFLRARRKKGR